MKNLLKPFLFFFTLFFLSSCKQPKEIKKEIASFPKKYEYRKEIIRYDFGNNNFEDIEIYINKNNDTLGGFQKVTYHNNIIDSTKSRFYTLSLNRNKTSNLYGGKLNYHFDPNIDGKLESFDFSVKGKYGDETEVTDFKNYNFKNNTLEFRFENDNDTIMGYIYAQHTKDTIENGETKVRIREVFLPVDNYNETNNPFVKIKL